MYKWQVSKRELWFDDCLEVRDAHMDFLKRFDYWEHKVKEYRDPLTFKRMSKEDYFEMGKKNVEYGEDFL